ncbi:MAG TPA: DUF2203 domain-containing protein [Dehalococcoidia bacterium]|nr:DUF2203 domain-containing protein [Dehalococcoidia bacterium]
MPQLFTREETDALLPHIAPLLTQARDLKRQYDEAQAALTGVQGAVKSNGHSLDVELSRATGGAGQAAAAIDALIERVNTFGVEVKDVEMGLCDFRSMLDGREVYLCWKLGEERVAYWHELHTGYASRQPLD